MKTQIVSKLDGRTNLAKVSGTGWEHWSIHEKVFFWGLPSRVSTDFVSEEAALKFYKRYLAE